MHLGGSLLQGITRCPFCNVANPTLNRVWQSSQLLTGADELRGRLWAGYSCTTCGNVITAAGKLGSSITNVEIDFYFPTPPTVAQEVPESPRKYLEQAYQTMHAPDAAVVMAASAVDGMLKSSGYEKGSLYARIDEAVENHLLTKKWGNGRMPFGWIQTGLAMRIKIIHT